MKNVSLTMKKISRILLSFILSFLMLLGMLPTFVLAEEEKPQITSSEELTGTYSTEESTLTIHYGEGAEPFSNDVLKEALKNGLLSVCATSSLGATYTYDSYDSLFLTPTEENPDVYSYAYAVNIDSSDATKSVLTFGVSETDEEGNTIQYGYLPSQITKTNADETQEVYTLTYALNDLYEFDGYTMDYDYNEDGTVNDTSVTITLIPQEVEEPTQEPEQEVEQTPKTNNGIMPTETGVNITTYYSYNEKTYTLAWNDNNNGDSTRDAEKNNVTNAFKNALVITATPTSGEAKTFTNTDDIGKALLGNVNVERTESGNTNDTIHFGSNVSGNTTGLPKTATIDGVEYALTYSLQNYTPTTSSNYIYQAQGDTLYATESLNFTGTVKWLDGKDLNTTRPDASTYVQALNLYQYIEGNRGAASVLDGVSFNITNTDGTELSTEKDTNGQAINNEWLLTVPNLPMYDLQGNPYAYYASQKTTITQEDGSETNFSKNPTTGLDTSSEEYLSQYRDNLSKGDYSAKFDNQQSTGNYKSIEDVLENGGTVSNTIENDIWIDLGKEWADGTNNHGNGTFYLYRISESSFIEKGFDQDGSPVTGYDNTSVQTTTDGTTPIAPSTEENETIQWKHIGVLTNGEKVSDGTLLTFDSKTYTGALPLYSSEGNRYIYYAVESVPSGYTATAHNDYYSTNDAIKYNGQTVLEAASDKNYVILGNYITNKKTGTTEVPVKKTFYNLAIQEIQDTTVTLALQSRVKTEDNSNPWTWYTTTSTSELEKNLGEDWNTKNTTSPYALASTSDANSYYVLATLSEFSADRLTISQDCTMPLYNNNYEELEYQWVEVEIDFAKEHKVSKGITYSNDSVKLSDEDVNGLLSATGTDGTSTVNSPYLMPNGDPVGPGIVGENTTLLFKASMDENGFSMNTVPAPMNFVLSKQATDSTSTDTYKKIFTYRIYANGTLLTKNEAIRLGLDVDSLSSDDPLQDLFTGEEGETTLTVTVNGGDRVSTTFQGLPRYDTTGKEIIYTAEEVVNSDETWHVELEYETKVVDSSYPVLNDGDTQVKDTDIKVVQKEAQFTNSIGPNEVLYIDASKEWLDDSKIDTRHPVNIALVNTKDNKIEQYATLREANSWYKRFTVNKKDGYTADDYIVIELDMAGSIFSSTNNTYKKDGVEVTYTNDASKDTTIGTVKDSTLKDITTRVNQVIQKFQTTTLTDIFKENTDKPSTYLQYCVGTIKETDGNKIQQDYNVYITKGEGKTGASAAYTIYNQRTATLNLHMTKTWVDAGDFLDANFTILRDGEDFGTFSLTKKSNTFTQEEDSVSGSVKWTSLTNDEGEYDHDKAEQGGVKFVSEKDTYTDGNYPKYDAYGVAYTYAVKESSIGGKDSNNKETTVEYPEGTDFTDSYVGTANNVLDMSNKTQTYVVKVTGTTKDEDYATATNHYNDGVYSWQIHNARSETTNLKVNKVWRDNGTEDRKLKLSDGTEETLAAIDTARASITLSLYRISTKNYASFAKEQLKSESGIITDLSTLSSKDKDEQIAFRNALIDVSEEVSGTKTWTTTDSDWWWHADLGSKERYDDNGYPYIYYVVENIIDDAAGYEATYFNGTQETYSTGYRPTKVDENDYSSSKDVFNPEKTTGYKNTDYNYIATVLVDGEEHNNVEYDDYYSSTIVNTPQKDVSVSGKKLWKLQNGNVLPESQLPEVTVHLYRSIVSSYENTDFVDENGAPLTSGNETKQIEYLGKQKATYATGFKYSFENKDDENGYYDYYNDYGQKWHYYAIEEKITGYELESTGSNFTLNNIYKPSENEKNVSLTINKYWDDKDPQNIHATFKLYGYATDKDGNVISSMKYLLATKKIDANNTADLTNGNTIVFDTLDSTNTLGYEPNEDGMYAKIPYLSPSTYPFVFEVEEEINGYTATFTDLQKNTVSKSNITVEETDKNKTTKSSGKKALVVEGTNSNVTVDGNTYKTYMGVQNTYDPADSNRGKVKVLKSWPNDNHYISQRQSITVTLKRTYTYNENGNDTEVIEYAKTINDNNEVTAWTTTDTEATKVTISSTDTWKKTFTDLQIYAQNGTKYTYSVSEDNTNGTRTLTNTSNQTLTYTVTQGNGVSASTSGTTTTITNTLSTTSVTGKKTWNIKDLGVDESSETSKKSLSSLEDDQLVLLYRSGAIPKYFRFYLVDENGNFYTKSNNEYSLSTTSASNQKIPDGAIYQQFTCQGDKASQIKSYLNSLEKGYTFDKLANYTYIDAQGAQQTGTYDIVEAYSNDGINFTTNCTWQYKGDSDTGKLSNKGENSGVGTTYAKNASTTTYTNAIDVSPVVVKKVWNDNYNSQNTRPDELKITVKTSNNSSVDLTLKKDNATNNKGNEYISDILYLTSDALDNAEAIESVGAGSQRQWDSYTKPTDNKATLHKTDGNKDTISKNVETCYYFELTNTLQPDTKKLTINATKKWTNYVPYEGGGAVGLNETIYLTLEYSTDSTENKTWQKATAAACGLTNDNLATVSISPNDYIDKDKNTLTDVTKSWEVNQYAQKSESDGNNTSSPKEIYYRVVETKQDGTHFLSNDEIAWTISYGEGDNTSSTPTVITGSNGTKRSDGKYYATSIINNSLEHTSLTVNKNWKYSNATDAMSNETVVTLRENGTLPYSLLYAIYAKTSADNTTYTLVKTLESSDANYSVTFNDLAKAYGNQTSTLVQYYIVEAGARYGSSTATPIYNSAVVSDNKVKTSLTNVDTTASTNGTIGAFDAWCGTWSYDAQQENQSLTASNTLNVGNLSISKTWDDENNRDNKQANDVSVSLYRIPVTKDGDKYVVVSNKNWENTNTTITLNADNHWSDATTLVNLPVKVAGTSNQYWAYAIDETAVTDYTTTYSTNAFALTDASGIKKDGCVVLETSQTQSVSITNTHEVNKISLTAKKQWIEPTGTDTSLTRSENIYLKLQYSLDNGSTWSTVPSKGNKPEEQETYYTSVKDGTVDSTTGIVTLASQNDATATWVGVPENHNGNAVKYRIVEVSKDGTVTKTIDSYDVSYEATDMKNTIIKNTLVYSSLNVTKNWVDDNNRDGLRGDVVLQLYRDNEKYGNTITLTSDTNYTYTWNNLPVYKQGSTTHLDKDKSTYKVEEVSVNGKTVDQSGYTTTNTIENVTLNEANTYTLTNTHTNKTFTIQASKKWIDNEDSNGLRPETITFELQYKNEEGEWSKVAETDETGKVPYILETKATKDVSKEDLATWTLEDDGTIEWTVTGYANGEEVEYRVIEKDVAKEYTSDHTQDSNNISVKYSDETHNVEVTNTLQTQSVEITKYYKTDSSSKKLKGAHYNITRKVKDEVQYFTGSSQENGIQIANWSKNASKALDIVTNDGGSIIVHGFAIGSYEFHEVKAPEGFEVDETPIPFTITSSNITEVQKVEQTDKPITPEYASITVEKMWNDDNDRDGLEGTIELQLYRDGKEYGEVVEVNADENGKYSYTWEQLPIYKDGVTNHFDESVSVYTIKEVRINGKDLEESEYTPTLKAGEKEVTEIRLKDVEGNVTLTLENVHTNKTFTIQASKKWIDNEDSNGLRPETITFELQYKNEEGEWSKVAETDETGKVPYILETKATKDVSKEDLATWTLEDDGTIEWIVTGYANGKEVEYRVIEKDVVKEYTSDHTQDSNGISVKYSDETHNVEVTNTLQTQSVKITKRSKVDDKLLEGAHYIVTRSVNGEEQYYAGSVEDQGVMVATWTSERSKAVEVVTGKDGTVTVDGFAMGSYEFYEVKAPQGYEIDSTGISFKITEDNISKVQEVEQKDAPTPVSADTSDASHTTLYAGMGLTSILVMVGLILFRKRNA